MTAKRTLPFLLAFALACVEAMAGRAAQPSDTVRARIGEAGCTLCHRDTPRQREPGDAPPLAPSFAEIAARYRDVPGAEQRLTRVVIDGRDPADRHWKDRLDFTAMGANAPRISPDEARAYVRWILAR